MLNTKAFVGLYENLRNAQPRARYTRPTQRPKRKNASATVVRESMGRSRRAPNKRAGQSSLRCFDERMEQTSGLEMGLFVRLPRPVSSDTAQPTLVTLQNCHGLRMLNRFSIRHC